MYSASKAAAEQFAYIAAKELGGRDITVNAVSPGATDTDMLRSVNPPEAIDEFGDLAALGRLGRPVDVARVVSFLVGPADDGSPDKTSMQTAASPDRTPDGTRDLPTHVTPTHSRQATAGPGLRVTPAIDRRTPAGQSVCSPVQRRSRNRRFFGAAARAALQSCVRRVCNPLRFRPSSPGRGHPRSPETCRPPWSHPRRPGANRRRERPEPGARTTASAIR